ncbi:hypothetical protein N868_18135 [Cellulomonas carbonis T26]|uniref:Uncharacterized protein n=2 Tax=Cellulomonas carbonis TaxID=1386092 RepID=A0A0A0BVB1_9CELL|nr:hypothetical protein N868_18135 [Cellulomonas carbonis T26]
MGTMGWFRCRATTTSTPQVPEGPGVLELRVHGVNNTPPAALLDVEPDDVELARGDSLGSFWTLTDDALSRARALAAHHHGHVRPDVRREAYSWGPMARHSPSAPGVGGNRFVAAASRAGWVLLLPLGITNAAYWSRRLEPYDSAHPRRQPYGRGAPSVRVFGLGLTLLLVGGLQTVSLDLVVTQCLADADDVCAALPQWVAGLASLEWGRRAAILSVVPLLGLLLLLWLSASSRTRYEGPTSRAMTDPDAPGHRAGPAAARPVRERPLLAEPGLWSRWTLTRSMARLHVAAGLALVSGTLLMSQVWGSRARCTTLDKFDGTCLAHAWEPSRRPLVIVLVLAVVVLAGSAWETARARSEWHLPGEKGGRVARASVLLGAGVVVQLLTVGAVWWSPAREPSADGVDPVTGLSFVPVLLVGVMLLVAVVALTWRRDLTLSRAAVVVAVLVAAALVLVVLAPRDLPGLPAADDAAWVAGALGVLLAVLCLLPVAPRRRDGRVDLRQEAWRGAAPGVLLLVALGLQMMLVSLVVVASGDWLNGAHGPQCLTELDGAPVAAACDLEDGSRVTVPPAYAAFAVGTVAGLVPAVVVLAVLALVLRGIQSRSAPAAGPAQGASLPAGSVPPAVGTATGHWRRRYPAGTLEELYARPGLAGAVARARERAALAQFGLLYLGVLAGALGVALVATLVFALVEGAADPRLAPVVTLGMWTTAGLWIAALVRVVTAQESGRPLALLWDLLCFLPRSAHPLGPPSYAERAVPELAARIDAWLVALDEAETSGLEGPLPDRPDRFVVVSAHSLGAVLATAALFAERPDRMRDRVALLTHGTQLRAYFGRLFPEILGPRVLGTAGCRGTTLAADPWRDADPPGVVDGGVGDASPESLVGILGAGPVPAVGATGRTGGSGGGRGTVPPAWLSLWRRTDPLGMPCAAYAPNPVDRGADELDATGYVAWVATHGGYTRTEAYRVAFVELVERLRARRG